MKKVFSIFEWLILAIIGIIALLLIILKLIGYDYYSVVSPSMGNEIPMGSFVIVDKVNEEEAKTTIINRFENDEIFSIVCQNEKMNIPLLHQVIDCDSETVTIHGIANDTGVNETFAYGDVLGIVVFSVPVLGYLTQWVNNLYFWVIFALVIAMYFIFKKLVLEILKKPQA